MPGDWKKLGAHTVGNFKLFELQRERYLSPRTGEEVNATIVAAKTPRSCS
jgi:hypothetical protein